MFARQGGLKMKSKMRRGRAGEVRARAIGVGENQLTGNDQVRIEIQSFLQALRSYPERFARNPRLTFEEHCIGLVQTDKGEPRRRD